MHDLRALKDHAARASDRQHHRKAAELYAQLAELEPGPDAWFRAGEAARRGQLLPEAMRHLALAARLYADGGFSNKAIAVAKVILRLDPGNAGATTLLAELVRENASRR